MHEYISLTYKAKEKMAQPKYGTAHVARAGVSMPKHLMPLVDAAAADSGVNRSMFISKVLADYFNYPLNLNTGNKTP